MATEKINIGSLGIKKRPRRAITGALLFEVRGVGNNDKADVLAGKLREVMAQRDDVKVSRPTKTVEIRITGLDDSVTSQEVAEVVVALGGCSPLDIKTGGIRMALSGFGTCWQPGRRSWPPRTY